MSRNGMCVILTLGMLVVSCISDANTPVFGQLFKGRSKERKTSVGQLAVCLDKLEKRTGLYGSVAAKAPDVWGQARLTQHREEFETQMAEQLTKFNFTLNGELAETDQAYLTQALAFSAALNAASAPAPKNSTSTTTVVATPSSGPSASSSSAANGATATSPASGSGGSGGDFPALPTVDTIPVQRTNLGGLLTTQFPGAANGPFLAVEPEVLLDQRARYLNHLHEIRRINEGDDNADSPGYSLNLVRIPISVLPGDRTKEGYGAEIAVTATPHLTDGLLPTTFRSLVINDLVDQLALYILNVLDLSWDKRLELEQLERNDDKENANMITSTKKQRNELVESHRLQLTKMPPHQNSWVDFG